MRREGNAARSPRAGDGPASVDRLSEAGRNAKPVVLFGIRRRERWACVHHPSASLSSRSTAMSAAAMAFLFVPKLCPKDVRNIETYLKISNSIEMPQPRKTGLLLDILIIFCAIHFSAASYTRVKSEVQVLYRPYFPFRKRSTEFLTRIAHGRYHPLSGGCFSRRMLNTPGGLACKS
jgi:hypothetical protein